MAKGIKTGGRTKGTPNKLTADIREAVIEAFEKAGGVGYLTKVAMESPQVFCTLLGKVLPLQVATDPERPLEMTIKWKS